LKKISSKLTMDAAIMWTYIGEMGDSIYIKNMENVHREYEKYVENIEYNYEIHVHDT
jgi:hypothetical protein